MGFRSLLKKVEAECTKEVEKYLSASTANKTPDAKPPTYDPANPPTRWEKAVFAMNGIVAQVSQIDPDGVDVVCFPGSGGEGGMGYDIYRNVKDTKGLEALVTAHEPKGDCKMGQAMDVVLKEAFERGFDGRPCSVLVLTAGRPSDHEALSKSLADAAKKVNKDADLTITFVQVGDDEWAEKYLNQLDTELTTTSADGEHIDIVDTIKDEEVQKAVDEMKGGKSASGMTGGIMGAFAGAAMGMGGVYLANKISKDKRTKGWNGQWKCIYEGDEMCVLDVKDDGEGNLEISGWQEEGTSVGSYAENDEGGFNIQHSPPEDDNEVIVGTIEDEHTIAWDDGTRWEEVPPENIHWGAYAGAAAAGAGAAGATGYLLEKKFFNKASNNVKSDYVIVLDRSSMMAIPDTGK
mmetsp:Transcript_9895/g.22235  ORF Transcript_9895/g.22235 Transcript_9895/m.22235 type:complete len:406 (-) Transcript_9895:149-1366(-)